MSGVSVKAWYQRVNAVWPTDLPTLTESEAKTAAKRLWKWATGRRLTLPIKFTSGRRYTWVYRGELRINAGRGWHNFVHNLSHYLWRQENNYEVRPHEKGHARFELRMRRQVLRRGWLNGALKKPEAEKPAPIVVPLEAARAARLILAEKREARMRARLALAEKKLTLAQRRVKALRVKVAYYDRKAVAQGDSHEARN